MYANYIVMSLPTFRRILNYNTETIWPTAATTLWIAK